MWIDLILQTLAETGEVTTEVFFTDYCNSYRNMYRRLYGRGGFDKIDKNKKENIRYDKQKFYNLLFYLQKQGFVKKKKINSRNFWSLTKAGIAKCKKLNIAPKKNDILKLPEVEKDFQKIIVFDIPEKERAKRDWLRWQLSALDFKMLQKSVWIGDSKLPKEFLEDLDRINILYHIHIFGITKEGTLNLERKIKG